MTKVHTSEGHQAKPHQYIRLTALCFGVASRKEHFKSAHFGGRQLAHLLDWLDSFLVGPAPNQMETAYNCSKNQTFKFA